MQYYRNLCETCGGTLKKVDDSHYGCESCGNVYSIEKVENYVEKLTKLLDEAKLGMVSSARENLYKAITREHLSSEEICKWCDEIKKYLPDDFQANFYGAFDGSELQDVATMIRNINIEENFQCLELLLNFLIKSLESELVTDTLYLIERAYKLFSNNLEKYNKYSTLVSIEAQKLDDCIYETNYPRDVFVAYSSKDSNKALELVSELEAQGLSCFIALRNLRHGSGSKENYEKALREAMDSCTSFVFISSMNSRNQACDALKVEIPYIKRRDEQRAASVPFTTYANIPIEYKKPRVEYRLEESTRRLASDRIVDEFFVGYERVYTPIDVAERVMRQSEIVLAEPVAQVAPQVDIAKLVEEQLRAQREAEEKKKRDEEERIKAEKIRLQQEEEARKKAEVIKYQEEAERRRKAEEKRLKEEEERKRRVEEDLRKRKAEEEERERKAEEERARKVAEEKKKCDLLYQEYLEIHEKTSQLITERKSLGFFDGKRKKEIDSLIEDCERQEYLKKEEIYSLQYIYGQILVNGVGGHIKFGSYPQTRVKDKNLIKTLNSKAGELPKSFYNGTSVNSYAWTSYNYYIEGYNRKFMWYIDVEEGGEKYRGVYFTNHRPYTTTDKSGGSNYYAYVVYWFKYEPIFWTVLSKDDKTVFLCCDAVIDSQQFDFKSRDNYRNNYAESTIRKWLNETFYNTAFSEAQKQHMLTTTVDNSVVSTGYDSNQNACPNTQDKIFLLSHKDVTNINYGFLVNENAKNKARQKKATDYAQSQGGGNYWWLRSPENHGSCCAQLVSSNGQVEYTNDASERYRFCNVHVTAYGIVPALQIKL